MVCANKWFRGEFLSTAIGLNMVFCYIGTLLNNFLTPFLNNLLGSPFKTSVCILMIISFATIMGFLYVIFSFKYEHLLEKKNKNEANNDKPEPTFKLSSIKELP